MTAFLLLVAGAVYGRHVVSGQFSSDDWSSLDAYRHLPDAGFWTLVRDYGQDFGGKPLLAVLLSLPPLLLGDVVPAWLGLAVVLGTATSVCWYVLLRTLGLERWPAAAVACLTLVAPWSSSGRLWATASVNNVAICLFLLGLVVALRALPGSGRGAWVRHGAAVLLYVASVLTYELAGTAALAAGALYLRRAPMRRALLRWAADLVAVGAALAWSAQVTTKHIPPLTEQLAWSRTFVLDGMRLTGDVVLPLGAPRELGLLLLAAVVAWALVCLGRCDDRDLRLRLWGWLQWALLGLAGTAASYLVLLPSAYYTPLSTGLEDRVNMVAALPMSLFVVAIWMVGLTLVLRGEHRALPVALVLALLPIANVLLLLDHQRDWRQAARLQDEVLTALRQMQPPPPGSTVYVYGVPGTVAPRLPVFADTWDLNAAVRLVREDRSLRSYPVLDGARLVCTTGGVRPERLPGLHRDLATPWSGEQVQPYRAPYWGVDQGAPYGSVVLLDVPSGQSRVVASRQDCPTALAAFAPGPLDRTHL